MNKRLQMLYNMNFMIFYHKKEMTIVIFTSIYLTINVSD